MGRIREGYDRMAQQLLLIMCSNMIHKEGTNAVSWKQHDWLNTAASLQANHRRCVRLGEKRFLFLPFACCTSLTNWVELSSSISSHLLTDTPQLLQIIGSILIKLRYVPNFCAPARATLKLTDWDDVMIWMTMKPIHVVSSNHNLEIPFLLKPLCVQVNWYGLPSSLQECISNIDHWCHGSVTQIQSSDQYGQSVIVYSR